MASVGVVKILLSPVSLLVRLIESSLFLLVNLYDAYMYSPLQTALWPVMEKVPRCININGRSFTIFTANIVSYSRTLLVIPIAITLKYNYYWTGFWCVMFHDFLDHVDGIVARVQKQKYGQVDDPIVGGFMDAFCDKIVNVMALWSILMVTDFSNMTGTQSAIFISGCAIIIAYEFTIGVVRVQDFFRAYYLRKFKKADVNSTKTSTAAVMAGKLKEKLESIGIAALCVAQSNPVVLSSISGIVGISCLYLSVRLAHTSLMSKLNARAPQLRSQAHASDDEDERKNRAEAEEMEVTSKELCNAAVQTEELGELKEDKSATSSDNEEEKEKESNNMHSDEKAARHQSPTLQRCHSLNDTSMDTRAERVYTVGCFDLFHHGHIKLLKQMRTFGKKVIVGVHDSRSIYQLKKRVPVDSTVTRMRNVKQYADEVFCVAGTDPSPFIEYIFDKRYEKSSTIYVRGDDMQHFPARHLCEKLMNVKFLPYTEGVSSTKLRKDLFNSGHCDFVLGDGLGDIMPY